MRPGNQGYGPSRVTPSYFSYPKLNFFSFASLEQEVHQIRWVLRGWAVEAHRLTRACYNDSTEAPWALPTLPQVEICTGTAPRGLLRGDNLGKERPRSSRWPFCGFKLLSSTPTNI